MKKLIAIIVILIIFTVIFGMNEKNKKEKLKENQETILRAHEQDLTNRILRIKEQQNADISWIFKLGYFGKEKDKFRNAYIFEIQDAFLDGKPHLIFGSLKDIKNGADNMFEISISDHWIKLETAFFNKRKLEYKFTCPKEKVNTLISNYNKIYNEEYFRSLQVVVVSQIVKVDEQRFSSIGTEHSELIEDEKSALLLTGDCKEIVLAPQNYGVIEKLLEKFN
jgi:hypothetical protein